MSGSADTDGHHQPYPKRRPGLAEALNAPAWIDVYVWLELYSSLGVLLIAMVLAFAAVDYMCPLQIPIWYAPQVIIPHFTASTVFFLGRGPHHPGQLISVRARVYSWLSLLLSVAGIAVGITFIILKCIHFFSSEVSAELKGNGGVFCWLMATCAAVIVIYGLNVYSILYSWYRSRYVLADTAPRGKKLRQ